jgi:hypothetical protein
MVLQQGLIGTIRVLAALVGVVDEASRWLTFPKGHLQSSDGQPCRYASRHGPTDNATSVQVQDSSQIEQFLLVTRGLCSWPLGYLATNSDLNRSV